MYEEITIKKHIDWKNLFIKIGILLLIVFILCALIMSPKKSHAETPYTAINKELLSTGKLYYSEDKLPTRIGRSNYITLQELVNNNLIKSDKYEKNGCNLEKSYVKVTKVSSNEFSIYSYLDCKKDKNTVADTITIFKDNYTEEQKENNFSTEGLVQNTNTEYSESTEEDFTFEVIE